MDALPITLAIFTKNNADSILFPINSVKNIVREIVIVDTGSTDNTCDIAALHGARIYKVGFTDFGHIRTLTAHLARQPWVLGLDSDEIINAHELVLFEKLILDQDVDCWGLPRRRWADFSCTQQIEKEAYPDYQYRFLKNSTSLYDSRRVHEKLDGAKLTRPSPEGPHIEHFHDIFKYGDRIKQRNNLYRDLVKQDINEGIEQIIPVVKVDEEKEKC